MTLALILFIITIAVNIAIASATYDAATCRKVIGTIGSNIGKIWMSGAIVAILMVVAGIGFGMTTAVSKAMAENERIKTISTELTAKSAQVKKPSVAEEPSSEPVYDPSLNGRKPWEFDKLHLPY